MKTTLLKFGVALSTLSLIYACEPEYPKRKKIADPIQPTESQNGDNSGNAGNYNNSGDQGGTDGGGDNSNTGSGTGSNNTNAGNGSGSDGNNTNAGNGNDSSLAITQPTVAVSEVYVCKPTALISPVSGRTNCFLKKGTVVKVSAVSILAEKFVSVTIPEKANGCTMLNGYFYSPDVSNKSSCDSQIK